MKTLALVVPLVALMLLLPFGVAAQSQTVAAPSQPGVPAAEDGTTLTLLEADAMALRNHPQVLASHANALRSNQLIREQQAAYYPTLNADATGAEANPGGRIGAGSFSDSRLFTHFGAGITISQLITDFGRTHDLVASSKLQADASRQDEQAAKDDVLLNVHQAYFGVLLAQSLMTIAEQTVKTRQTVVDQIAELTRNKLKSDLDLSFAQTNLSDAQLMQIRARNNLSSAYANLNDALGTDAGIRYTLVNQPLPDAPPSDAAPLVQTAFLNRPELASLRANYEADQKFAAAERDLKRPTVSLSAVAGGLPYILPGSANADIPDLYQGAAVNVQVPIFNGHLFSARAQAATLAAVESSERLRDQRDHIARDTRNALGRAQTAFQAISASQQLLKEANSALDLAQGRYQLGLSSIVELTQAQLLQTQAQVGLSNSQFEYQQAYSALQYQQGLLH